MSSTAHPPPTPRRRRRAPNGEPLPAGVDVILEAAVRAMSERGYHGTSVREIAERAGMSPAALYHHFPSKHALLATIMEQGIEELLSRTEAAREAAGPDPVAALRAIVEVQVLFHLEDQHGTLLGTSELRGLEQPARSAHLAKRQRQQRIFDDVVADGVARGVFRTAYPVDASRAVVVMCTGVASWFRADGRLTRTRVAQRYQDLALELVSYRRE